MGVGASGTWARRFAVLIGLGFVHAPALAVDSGVVMPTPPAADAPAGEGLCAVPGATSAVEAPLPHLARHLRTSRTVRVLAIGSSSTFGIGASSPRASYPARLEGELEQAFRGLDVEMLNRGVSGEIAAQTARRLRMDVARHQPDLVIWQVGTNDALARVALEDLRATITETVRWLKAQDTDLVLVGLQYTRALARDAHYRLVKEVVREVATAENVPLVRRYEAMEYIASVRGRENLLDSDEFHLNDLGYRCMAEHVARAIVTSVFARPRAGAGPGAGARVAPSPEAVAIPASTASPVPDRR